MQPIFPVGALNDGRRKVQSFPLQVATLISHWNGLFAKLQLIAMFMEMACKNIITANELNEFAFNSTLTRLSSDLEGYCYYSFNRDLKQEWLTHKTATL